ncbi:MAG: hypothetical protein IPN92_05910 [Chromatiaceae bacterium]|nr:hypothetical protein [Chromatiaceae bacterium]
MTHTLLILLKLAIRAIILMDSRLKDLTYPWHRPLPLVRPLLAMYLLVPLAVLVLTGRTLALLVLHREDPYVKTAPYPK